LAKSEFDENPSMERYEKLLFTNYLMRVFNPKLGRLFYILEVMFFRRSVVRANVLVPYKRLLHQERKKKLKLKKNGKVKGEKELYFFTLS
jgi:hypothetical protein